MEWEGEGGMIENSITEVWETPAPPDLRCHQCRATGVYLFTRGGVTDASIVKKKALRAAHYSSGINSDENVRGIEGHFHRRLFP